MTTLNEAEQKLARYLAKRRYEANRESGTPNKKVGPQSDEDTDLNGIGAEIAFCKMLNVYPDTDLNTRPIADALTKDGISCDVKCTKYQNGHLLAVDWKKDMSPDAYVLMVGEFPSYRCAGWIAANDLFALPQKDMGYGPTYAAPQSELRPLNDTLLI